MEQRFTITTRKSSEYILIKFHKKEIIELTQNGSIRMNSLSFYRDLYENTNDENIGDPFEGKLYVHEADVLLNNQYFHLKDTAISTLTQDDFVYCMFGIKTSQIGQKFNFTEQHKRLWENEYDTALIITDTREFKNRLVTAANELGYKLGAGFVIYYSPEKDCVDRIINSINHSCAAFFKRNCYSYQNEFRFRIANPDKKKFLDLNIGDIHDISETVDLKYFLKAYCEPIDL